MSLAIQKAEPFKTDFERRFAWYMQEAGDEVAWRFQTALDRTLLKLSRQPDLGRLRRFRHPVLQGLRSFPVAPQFNRLLIFYRTNGDVLQAWRLMHGARDLSRRLVEPPDAAGN